MLKIKLARIGKKHQPEYRVIVQEQSRDPWGPATEILGHYNPRTNPSTVELKKERIQYWIDNGAQVTESAHNILVEAGVLQGKKKKAVSLTKKRQAKLGDKKKVAEEAKPAKEALAEKPVEAPVEVLAEEKPAEEVKPEKVEETPAEAPATEAKTE